MSLFMPVSFFQLGRADPEVRDIAYLFQQAFNVAVAILLDVSYEKLVGPQTDENERRLEFAQKNFQRVRLAPVFGRGAVPDDAVESVAVLFSVGRESRIKAFEHGIAYYQYAL